MAVAAGSAEKHDKHNGQGETATSAIERPLAQFSEEIADFDKQVRDFVRERPLLSIGAAVVVGYVVGRVLSKL